VDDHLAGYALFLAGYIMQEAGRTGLAFNLFARCQQMGGKQASIYMNQGMCLEDIDIDRSAEQFEKALKLDPKHPKALANMGLCRLLMADPDGCIEYSDKALTVAPREKQLAPYHNKGLALLMKRDWSDGWAHYYETIGVKAREARQYGEAEDWDGVSRGTLVVYGEQGVGDEIMFASIFNDLPSGMTVVLDTDRRLATLMARTFPHIHVYGTRFEPDTDLLDDYSPDYQIACGQLPHFYRNSDDSFPGQPFLRPDPERCVQWRALFDTFEGRKIGIAWRGGLPNTLQKNRSLAPDDLLPLRERFSGDTLVSLEYHEVDDDTAHTLRLKRYDETRKGRDIDPLAALIAELDFVITACTTVVYLCGALGVPCFVMVPNRPGYRYHIEGAHFPWFNSVTLLRQLPRESWGTATKRFANLIEREINDVKYHDRLRSAGGRSLPRPVPQHTEPVVCAGDDMPDQPAKPAVLQA
jgi:hypothetical protein